MEQMMTIKEATRLGIMKEIEKRGMSYKEAGKQLKLSRRQVIRLMKSYRKEGDQGVISKKRGKSSPRKIEAVRRIEAIELIKDKYPDFGPTLAAEKLEEYDKLTYSRETIRKWLIEEGLWKSKRRKRDKIYARRERRSRIGELVQIDGSYHLWFEDRGEKCCLILFVDDATSQIMLGRFCRTETTKEYMEALKSYIGLYGKPRALYSDKHSIFRINYKETINGYEETQLGRALKELDIELICANSPQAKGRVERANETLQDRLVKEMRLRKINNPTKGNQYLTEFITSYNEKFGKAPKDKEDSHQKNDKKLDEILAIQETRKLSKELSFQYKNQIYQISSNTPNRLRYKKVNITETDPILVKYGEQELTYSLFSERPDNRPKILGAKELEANWRSSPKRTINRRHAWR